MNQESSAQPGVAHVLGSLQVGGAEMALVNYLRAADKTAYRHQVLCLSHEGRLAPLVRELGVPVTEFRVRMRNLPVDLWRLSRWYRANRIAIVHTHMFYASFWGRLAGLLARVPLMITTEHGKEPWKKGWQIAVDRFLRRFTFRHIAVSEDVRTIRINRDRAPADMMMVIPNSVTVPDDPRDPATARAIKAEFGIGEDEVLLGTVGRVVDAKDYPLLAAALKRCLARNPRLRWLQVGEGPDLAALKQTASNLGLGDRVIFAGNRSDVPSILQALDVWVMSSKREGLPVALLEAMAYGKPIVATVAGGIPDAVVDGESALLVPVGDEEKLAAAILEVVGDEVLAGNLAEAARRKVRETYGSARVARTIEAVYAAGLGKG